MKKNRFFKTSSHGYVGSNISFHAKDGKGYTTNICNAHIYTRNEAQAEVNRGWIRSGNSDELFLSADHVDELAVWKVDYQYINLFYPETKDPQNEYVAYKKNAWNGNDVGFATELNYSYDYSRARIFNEKDLKDINSNDWFIIPKFHADGIARKTFQHKNINRRKMISCAGIIGIRQRRQTHSTGKTKMNCPACGKFVWQYDPYEFISCSDIYCRKHFF